MKLNYKILLLFTATLFFAACTMNTGTKTAPNTADLAEKLKGIARQENIDFYKKDLNAWSKHFLHTDAVYWICVEDDVTLRATGWDDLNQFVSSWMKENPTPDADDLLKKDTIEDFKVETSDGLAFVRYKKKQMLPDGKTKVILESRTFKRSGNDWKIIGMTSAPGYTTAKSTANVFTHNDGLK